MKKSINKTILFVGAGIESVPGISLAIQMGLNVVVSDIRSDAPGMHIAHDKLIASTYDIDGTVEAAVRYHNTIRPINGVTCLGTDVPLTVAKVAARLGLPGHTLETATLASDKLAMKERFKEFGVAIPWYSSVESIEELNEFISIHTNLVIKPVDSRGARGVLKISNDVDLDWAFNFAKSNSPSERVMVEKYLNGPQISTESIVIDGVCHTIGFSDRNYEFLNRFKPHIIENGGELPSVLDAKHSDGIHNLVASAGHAMGVMNGIIKGDIVLHDEVPHVIEIAARLSGGYFCTHEIPLNTGVNFVEIAIRQCIGEKISNEELLPNKNNGVAQRFMFPNPGWVSSIEVPEWVSQDPDISLFEIRVKVGDLVKPIHNHPARAGVVIATGINRKSAVAKAEEVIKAVKITTSDLKK